MASGLRIILYPQSRFFHARKPVKIIYAPNEGEKQSIIYLLVPQDTLPEIPHQLKKTQLREEIAPAIFSQMLSLDIKINGKWELERGRGDLGGGLEKEPATEMPPQVGSPGTRSHEP